MHLELCFVITNKVNIKFQYSLCSVELSCTLHINEVLFVFQSLSLPVSSAVVSLDSPSSVMVSSSLTKLEGNSPDLPFEFPLHQPSSTCKEKRWSNMSATVMDFFRPTNSQTLKSGVSEVLHFSGQ